MDPFAGASMLLIQLGARHLVMDLSQVQQKFLKLPMVQCLVLTAIFYMSTRNIVLSILMTFIYYITLFIFLNEKHPMNILPRWWLVKEGFMNPSNKKKKYISNLKRLYLS